MTPHRGFRRKRQSRCQRDDSGTATRPSDPMTGLHGAEGGRVGLPVRVQVMDTTRVPVVLP